MFTALAPGLLQERKAEQEAFKLQRAQQQGAVDLVAAGLEVIRI